jgi:hypothetical protein
VKPGAFTNVNFFSAIDNRRSPYEFGEITQAKRLSHIHTHTHIYIYILVGPVAQSVATGYELDGPGIESRVGRDFSHTSSPAMRPTQPPVQWVPGLSRGKTAGAWC